MARGAVEMSGAGRAIGLFLYWSLIATALLAALLAINAAAFLEGEERLLGTAGRAAFALGAWLLARLARHLLPR